MTVTELRGLAKERGMKGYTLLKKVELEALLFPKEEVKEEVAATVDTKEVVVKKSDLVRAAAGAGILGYSKMSVEELQAILGGKDLNTLKEEKVVIGAKEARDYTLTKNGLKNYDSKVVEFNKKGYRTSVVVAKDGLNRVMINGVLFIWRPGKYELATCEVKPKNTAKARVTATIITHLYFGDRNSAVRLYKKYEYMFKKNGNGSTTNSTDAVGNKGVAPAAPAKQKTEWVNLGSKEVSNANGTLKVEACQDKNNANRIMIKVNDVVLSWNRTLELPVVVRSAKKLTDKKTRELVDFAIHALGQIMGAETALDTNEEIETFA